MSQLISVLFVKIGKTSLPLSFFVEACLTYSNNTFSRLSGARRSMREHIFMNRIVYGVFPIFEIFTPPCTVTPKIVNVTLRLLIFNETCRLLEQLVTTYECIIALAFMIVKALFIINLDRCDY